MNQDSRHQGPEASGLVDMLSGNIWFLALGLAVVVLFLLSGCAFGDGGEVLTNRWKFPWSADAVRVDYCPGLQTFVYTHRYPGAANISDSSVVFAYYEEGFSYRQGDIVVLDPDPPGGANNTFIDLCFNASLMADFGDYLRGVVARLAGGVSGFVLGDEWPRGLNRDEIDIQKLSRYNQTYHDETGRWMGFDPDLGDKRALADWFYMHSIEAWNCLAWEIRSCFPDIYLGTNIDLVWEPDYAGSDVSHWRATDWWGEVDLEPYDFVVTHYFTRILQGDYADPVQVDDRGVAGLGAALTSLFDPVSNVTQGRDVFLMLRAHCTYPYITTPMQMVKEWNAALEFGDRLAGVGWFTFDEWIYYGSIAGRSIADFNPAPMSADRLLTLRCLANLNRFGECGGWILVPQMQIRMEPENITLVEGCEVEFNLIVKSYGWEGELHLHRIEWSGNPDLVLDYDFTSGLPPDQDYVGFVAPGADIRLRIRMRAPSLIRASTTAETRRYCYRPVLGHLVFLVSPSTCKEGIGLVKVYSNPLHLSGSEVIDLTPLSTLTNLVYLDLSNSQVGDLTPLSTLTKLDTLDLHGNQVSDLTPLSNLAKLTHLYLLKNLVSDLTPLSTLKSLTYLDLRQNQVSDLTPLSNLTNLTDIDLHDNQVGDLTPLSNLTRLENLDLAYNQVGDLTPLSTLPNLRDLYLGRNQISDLTPLSNLTRLENLDLAYNQVGDLTPLSNLTNLTDIDLHDNQVGDLTPLSTLTKLRWLYLQDNYLDLSEGSKAMTDIQALISRGVRVTYQPQNTGPVPVNEGVALAMMAVVIAVYIMISLARLGRVITMGGEIWGRGARGGTLEKAMTRLRRTGRRRSGISRAITSGPMMQRSRKILGEEGRFSALPRSFNPRGYLGRRTLRSQ